METSYEAVVELLPFVAVTEKLSFKTDMDWSLIAHVSAENIVAPSVETVRFP